MSLPVFPSLPLRDPSIGAKARSIMDNKTKPLGSLGRLEDLAVRLASIQGREFPEVSRRALAVFAADHGLAAEGVSAYPAAVTWQMVRNFSEGGAAVNVLCRQLKINMLVTDVGVLESTASLPGVVQRRVAPGTDNCSTGFAMSTEQAKAALEAGMASVDALRAAGGLDLLALGEMGIGNSSAAVLLIAGICGLDPAAIAGRGTGLDDAGLARKQEILRRVWQIHGACREPFELLCRVGGFEIAAIAGAAIRAGSLGIPVLLDGLICTAAGLLAAKLCPGLEDFMIVAHRSAEMAQAHALEHLGLEPLLGLGMRLGEGSGAALAVGLCDAACALQREMASFESAGVSRQA